MGSNATSPLDLVQQEQRQRGRQAGQGCKKAKFKFLDKYCENLTQKARDGKLDDVIGREQEIYRTIQILARRQKNNPCLIGEAGVGKTAIAEGIAQRIARKRGSRLLERQGAVPAGFDQSCGRNPVPWPV